MALIRLNTRSAPADTFGGGKILQVQYTQFDGINDITVGGANEVEFSDLSVNITPTATNSIILLQAQVMGEFASRNMNWNGAWYFRRDTTSLRHPAAGLGGRTCGIAVGYISHEADNLSTAEGVTYSYYDATHNTTSQVTYKVTFFSPNGAANYNLNHTVLDTNSSNYERFVSFISATEISG